jgi:hypothetical protein
LGIGLYSECVLEALAALPDLLLTQDVNAIYRMQKSIDPGNPATTNTALGDTVLYDSAFAKKYNLTQILCHELSHQLYEKLSDSQKRDYQSKMFWQQETVGYRKRWVPRRPAAQFVTQDATLSPSEDFATNIEYFLFNPSHLKKTVPEAHAWIEKHFGDKLKVELKK